MLRKPKLMRRRPRRRLSFFCDEPERAKQSAMSESLGFRTLLRACVCLELLVVKGFLLSHFDEFRAVCLV